MFHKYTKAEVELAIAASDALLSTGITDDSDFLAEWRKTVNLREECEKALNLLENLQHWMQRAEDAEFRLKGLDK